MCPAIRRKFFWSSGTILLNALHDNFNNLPLPYRSRWKLNLHCAGETELPLSAAPSWKQIQLKCLHKYYNHQRWSMNERSVQTIQQTGWTVDWYAFARKVVYDLYVWAHDLQNSQSAFLTILGLVVTLIFDSLTSKSTQFIFVPNCT